MNNESIRRPDRTPTPAHNQPPRENQENHQGQTHHPDSPETQNTSQTRQDREYKNPRKLVWSAHHTQTLTLGSGSGSPSGSAVPAGLAVTRVCTLHHLHLPNAVCKMHALVP